jgi:hypothetical protein
MANTFTLISETVLSSSQATITFSSITSTYTDLVVRASVRCNGTGFPDTNDNLRFWFNNSLTNIYSNTYLEGTGSTTGSNTNSLSFIKGNYSANGSTSTSNTFSNIELYIPSYTVSQNKPLSLMTAQENNTTAAYIVATAGLFRSTTAISRIDIDSQNGNSFVSGSSFYLYGIKNS